MRRSAASQRSRAVAMSPASAAMRASASRAKTSTWASSSPPGVVEDRRRVAPRRRVTRSAASIAASRHSPSAACSPPPAARCHAVAASSAVRAPCVLSERAQDAPEMDPGERRQAYVAGGFGLVDRELERCRTGVVVAGLALRSSEAGELVGLGLPKAETSRRLRGATDVERRRRRTGAGCGPARRASRRGGRGATGRRRFAASAGRGRALRRCAPRRRPRSRLGRRRASSRPDPTAGPARRRAHGCDRSAPARGPNSP